MGVVYVPAEWVSEQPPPQLVVPQVMHDPRLKKPVNRFMMPGRVLQFTFAEPIGIRFIIGPTIGERGAAQPPLGPVMPKNPPREPQLPLPQYEAPYPRGIGDTGKYSRTGV